MWYVYVLQSQQKRFNKWGKELPGFYYVGCTTDYERRLRQHNGEILGGGKYTSQYRPWIPKAVYGTYPNRSIAMKAERALKSKRGKARTEWTLEDSKYCCGLGTEHEWVKSFNTPTT